MFYGPSEQQVNGPIHVTVRLMGEPDEPHAGLFAQGEVGHLAAREVRGRFE